jgi:hypothetical protein
MPGRGGNGPPGKPGGGPPGNPGGGMPGNGHVRVHSACVHPCVYASRLHAACYAQTCLMRVGWCDLCVMHVLCMCMNVMFVVHVCMYVRVCVCARIHESAQHTWRWHPWTHHARGGHTRRKPSRVARGWHPWTHHARGWHTRRRHCVCVCVCVCYCAHRPGCVF